MLENQWFHYKTRPSHRPATAQQRIRVWHSLTRRRDHEEPLQFFSSSELFREKQYVFPEKKSASYKHSWKHSFDWKSWNKTNPATDPGVGLATLVLGDIIAGCFLLLQPLWHADCPQNQATIFCSINTFWSNLLVLLRARSHAFSASPAPAVLLSYALWHTDWSKK